MKYLVAIGRSSVTTMEVEGTPHITTSGAVEFWGGGDIPTIIFAEGYWHYIQLKRSEP